MSGELAKAVSRETLNPKYPYMPKQERDGRIARARALMKQKGMDAIILASGQNQRYFFGSTRTYRNVFPSLAIVPVEGPAAFAMEYADSLVLEAEGYADLNVGFRGDGTPSDTAPDPVILIAELIKELGLEGKVVGMELGDFMWWDTLTLGQWERIRAELGATKFVDATDLIWELRSIKTPWEVEVMRHLHTVTAKSYGQLLGKAAPGANEKELFNDMLRYWIDAGIVDSTNYTLNCINAVQPFRDRVLADGDWIMLDGGPTYKGYCADMQRLVRIGMVDPAFEQSARLASEGMWAVEEILKPGVTAGEIWQAAYGVMAAKRPELWFTARSRRMVGWVGHGMGLNIHEPPYFVEGSEAVLKPGMIVAVEVPSYHERTFANMPEDTYLITETGYDKLSIDLGPTETYIRT